MENINNNLEEINKTSNVVNNLEDLINNSFVKLQKSILNTMNNKIEKLSKYLIINQTNTQNELKELRKENNNIFITINNTEKKLDKKLSEIYKNIDETIKRNKNDIIKGKESKNKIFEQRINESMGKQINSLRLDLSLIHNDCKELMDESTKSLKRSSITNQMDIMMDKLIQIENTQKN
eukprot:464738_1